MSRILPTPLVFISGYANTENVFYCLNIWVLKVPFLHIYTKKNLQQSCMLKSKRFQCFRWIWVPSYVPYLPVYKSIPHFGAKKKCFSYFWVRFFLKNLSFILKFSFRYANLPGPFFYLSFWLMYKSRAIFLTIIFRL